MTIGWAVFNLTRFNAAQLLRFTPRLAGAALAGFP